MGCIALVRCVLVLLCGLAGVVWYPYAGLRLHADTTPQFLSLGKYIIPITQESLLMLFREMTTVHREQDATSLY